MRQTPGARLRGAAVGVLTASLAVAAHGQGGGVRPSSTGLALLLIACAGVGAFAAEAPSAGLLRGRLSLLGTLFGGQVLGHLLLTATADTAPAAVAPGHIMAHSPAISAQMLLAHLGVAAVCAALLEVIERLYGPLTSLIRAVVRLSGPLATARRTVRRPEEPRPPVCLLAADAISRRGPPALV